MMTDDTFHTEIMNIMYCRQYQYRFTLETSLFSTWEYLFYTLLTLNLELSPSSHPSAELPSLNS